MSGAGRARQVYWRRIRLPISRWRDRRYQARHLREYGWPIHMGSGPFSHSESRWHECAGHDWERIDWPYGRHRLRGHRPDRVTRCRNCGAPRCDSYHGIDSVAKPATDNDWQGIRCTWGRHHLEPHDYLSGTQIEVGA